MCWSQALRRQFCVIMKLQLTEQNSYTHTATDFRPSWLLPRIRLYCQSTAVASCCYLSLLLLSAGSSGPTFDSTAVAPHCLQWPPVACCLLLFPLAPLSAPLRLCLPWSRVATAFCWLLWPNFRLHCDCLTVPPVAFCFRLFPLDLLSAPLRLHAVVLRCLCLLLAPPASHLAPLRLPPVASHCFRVLLVPLVSLPAPLRSLPLILPFAAFPGLAFSCTGVASLCLAWALPSADSSGLAIGSTVVASRSLLLHFVGC